MMRVLIVDDNEVAIEMLRGVLAQAGYAVECASNGLAALAAGADDFIAKPFKAAELLARVRTGERVVSLETRDVAIFAMAKLAESRDPETGAHLERVRSYSRLLAQHLAGIDKFQ